MTARIPPTALIEDGVALGAGGLWWFQERYLPPRLSATESRELRSAFEQADAERKNLTAQLAATTKRLDASQAANKRQAEELAAPRAAAERLRLSGLFWPEARERRAAEVRVLREEALGRRVAVREVELAHVRTEVRVCRNVIRVSVQDAVSHHPTVRDGVDIRLKHTRACGHCLSPLWSSRSDHVWEDGRHDRCFGKQRL